MNWKKILTTPINFTLLNNVIPTKGNITYEYNPFHNYRINQNMYEYDGGLYSLADLWNNFGITLKCEIKVYNIDINKLKDPNILSVKNVLYIKYPKQDNEDENEYKEKIDNIFKSLSDDKKLEYTKEDHLISEYNNSNIKYYEVSIPENVDFDYSETAKIIIEAFKEGRNADRLNLEKALKDSEQLVDKNAWYFKYNDVNKTNPYLREAGEITDFITDELSFDLEHPVQILPLYSYDGSVNLILNDGKNFPKLINSRFSATGKNTYEVCDRKGNNDTNIYDLGEAFELDTSLYKLTESIALLEFEGVTYGGALKVGNYHFYFKVADADGNESDFIAESGLVSIFLGSNSYLSVSTGERDQNSNKLVCFYISNLDTSYDYVHVYYSRYTAENNLNRTIEYKKIEKNYIINNSNSSNIIISGFELTTDVTAEDINLQFNIVDSAYTSAVCLNMLFMANVHNPDIPYAELLDLSLRILPYLNVEDYEGKINQNYTFLSTNKGYIDPKYIYEKTGYWTEELYRFGIVYIMPNNTLSPVFNIRGGYGIGTEETTPNCYTKIDLYDKNNKRKYITSDEENYKLIPELDELSGECLYENIKGVVGFTYPSETDKVFSVKMVIPHDVNDELSKYVKGYFFVRQPRIPFVLAQGITIGINKESGTPTIPTKRGIVDTIINLDLSQTHVCISSNSELPREKQLEGEVVYLSEGFLSRYKFKFKEKSSHIWKKIGTLVGAVVAVAASIVASVVSFGTASWTNAITIPFLASALGAMGGLVATGAIAVVAVGVTTAIVASAVAGIQELVYKTQAAINKRSKTYNRWNTAIPSGYKIVELDDSRKLTLEYELRVILTASDENYVAGIICPDFEVDQPHFNTLFIGDEHMIKYAKSLGINLLNYNGDNYFDNDGERHFYMPEYQDITINDYKSFKIIPITDNQKLGIIEDLKFRARAGEAEEAWRVEAVGSSFRSAESKKTNTDDEETINNRQINSDIIRGSFGPYLGFYDKNSLLLAGSIVNIYTAGYDLSNMDKYMYLRACDNNTFYTISERYEITSNKSMIVGVQNTNSITHIVYRGDCYLCQFTHRINRNFQDPGALFNDEIVEEDTWKKNYNPGTQENLNLINNGDVNAVLLGTWVTFKIRSSNNLNIRTEDISNVDEHAMSGHPRTYFPKTPMSVEGTYKTPESSVFNAGFKKLLSERYNFEVPDVPWIKNWFGTRIMYSNINVSDSFLNGFRVFKGTHYRDYTREYGEITKLISFESSLLCVFEHGIALIPVNERAIAAEGAGGFAYINTSNVLPENPKIISDVYGSLWADSILKVPGKFGNNIQYVYGVDTVAKKIWRTDGQTLECISDKKVQEFLNNNITLSEFELTPKLGIRNVKTFYNAFKRDVMFTFYDNTYGFEEKVWNLCFNELMNTFVTFYSWVPSVMENINNIPFSFNRNTTKWIAKLGTSHANSSFADGITLNNVVLTNDPNLDGSYIEDPSNYKISYSYTNSDGDDYTIKLDIADESKPNLIGVLSLSSRILPELEGIPEITYKRERDPYGNYKKFTIKEVKVESKDHNYCIDGKFRHPDIDVLVNGQIVLKKAKYSGVKTFWGLYFDGNNYSREEISNLKDKKSKLKELEEQLSELESKESTLDQIKELNELIEQIKNEIVKLLENLNKINSNNSYSLMSEIYYRNISGHAYSDEEINKISIYDEDEYGISVYNPKIKYFITCIENLLPIYKNKKGLRENLNESYNKNLIVTLLNIKANIEYKFNDRLHSLAEDYFNLKAGYESGTSLIDAGYYQSTIAIIPKWNLGLLSTDFWRHGLAGIIDIADKIYPTYWYGEQHPFEFEFIVANEPGKHKIFDNLQIISNKAEPESFHYEIVGECYDFAKDKENMYIRQEATKELYQYNGSDITFNHDYNELKEYHRPLNSSSTLYEKSTLFPLYYGRLEHINEIYNSYKQKNGKNEGKDYDYLAGAELILYNNLNEIRIRNNCKGVNIKDHGLRLGNMLYKEDLWNIQINPINLVQCNEPDWGSPVDGKNILILGKSDQIPVEINTFAIPEDIKDISDLDTDLNTDTFKERGVIEWTSDKVIYSQADIKDKYLKVRIRYSGKNLAIIQAINTLYTISYA